MTSLPRTQIEGPAMPAFMATPDLPDAPQLESAVKILKQENAQRVLVLGRADGVAAHRLQGESLDIVVVDCAAHHADLASAALRAQRPEMGISASVPPAGKAPAAIFDAVVADMQDGPGVPAAYLATDFWADVKLLLQRGGLVLVNVTDELHAVRAWGPFQHALATSGFTAMVVSQRHACGNRLLVTSRAR
jgi:predicted membrane-bound spermidine synthase